MGTGASYSCPSASGTTGATQSCGCLQGTPTKTFAYYPTLSDDLQRYALEVAASPTTASFNPKTTCVAQCPSVNTVTCDYDFDNKVRTSCST